MVNWILQYILTIVDVDLKFEKDKKLGQLIGHVDYDFTNNLDKRHLTIECTFTL